MVSIVPRSVIGLPEPPATRPKLAPGLHWLICHYTGVNGYAADPSKDLQYAKSVAYFGMNRQPPIPYEYNYLIGPGGTVYEQAGDFKGAHCLNLNPSSIGVLMMLGVGVQPTQAMMDSFVALRWQLVDQGRLSPDHEAVPHYYLRSTACPGLTLASPPAGAWPSPTGEGRIGRLRDELLAQRPITGDTTPPPSIPVPDSKEEIVFTAIIKWATHDAQYACYSDGTKKWIAPGSGQAFRGLLTLAGKDTTMITISDAGMMRATGPIVGPLPAGVDAYGCPV